MKNRKTLIASSQFLSTNSKGNIRPSEWDKSTGITITESQITDLQSYSTVAAVTAGYLTISSADTTYLQIISASTTYLSLASATASYLTIATATTSYLLLDQTTPQTVTNGTPTFMGGISVGTISITDAGSSVLDIVGTVQPDAFNSSDGTVGTTGTIILSSFSTIEVKDGLIVGWAE